MNWWRKLKGNSLAKYAAIVLLSFYLIVTFAEFVAPYSPYDQQLDGSLLPPTQIFWRNQQGQFIGPHVYPTTQGTVDMNTGERELRIDRSKPAPIRLFVRGSDYKLFSLIPGNIHLFGTAGDANLNLLGTDDQARDQLSRLVYGGRISLFIGLIGIVISYPIGMIVGGISGYFGGITDSVLMRIVEVLMTLPTIYLLITLAGMLPEWGSTLRFVMIVLITSFVSWAGLARVIRGQVLSLKEQSFVQAAKVMGGEPLYIILRHVLPQTATYLIISATLTVPSFILAEAVLSLIGLGIQQPDPSWGNMLSLATNASILVLQPWLVWSPAILIVVTILAFNLLGDGLRDALDPRSLGNYPTQTTEAIAKAEQA